MPPPLEILDWSLPRLDWSLPGGNLPVRIFCPIAGEKCGGPFGYTQSLRTHLYAHHRELSSSERAAVIANVRSYATAARNLARVVGGQP